MARDPSSVKPEYTAEQLALVERIRACKDFYSILCIDRDASLREIKQSYKRIALKLHPDKNKAPGAQDAFKAVVNAVTVLTNVTKRSMYEYNLYKREQQIYRRDFDDIDEESSHVFFDRKFESNEMGNDGSENEDDDMDYHKQSQNNMWLFLLLLAFALNFYMVTSIIFTKPAYSISPSSKYPIRRCTQILKVAYYVKENFSSEYQRALESFELGIEEEYMSNLKFQCYYGNSINQCFWYIVYHILKKFIDLIGAFLGIFLNEDEFLI